MRMPKVEKGTSDGFYAMRDGVLDWGVFLKKTIHPQDTPPTPEIESPAIHNSFNPNASGFVLPCIKEKIYCTFPTPAR